MYMLEESNTELTRSHEKPFTEAGILTIRPPGRYEPTKLTKYDKLGGFTCAQFLFWESQCGGELGQLCSTPSTNDGNCLWQPPQPSNNNRPQAPTITTTMTTGWHPPLNLVSKQKSPSNFIITHNLGAMTPTATWQQNHEQQPICHLFPWTNATWWTTWRTPMMKDNADDLPSSPSTIDSNCPPAPPQWAMSACHPREWGTERREGQWDSEWGGTGSGGQWWAPLLFIAHRCMREVSARRHLWEVWWVPVVVWGGGHSSPCVRGGTHCRLWKRVLMPLCERWWWPPVVVWRGGCLSLFVGGHFSHPPWPSY